MLQHGGSQFLRFGTILGFFRFHSQLFSHACHRFVLPELKRAEVDGQAALLSEQPDKSLRGLSYGQEPYWDIERARIGDSRNVLVEIVVNGKPAASQKLLAAGKPREMNFEIPITTSSWIAARVLPAAHTNPVFVIVDGQQIRASRRSAEWALKGVNQCWTQKAPRISPKEIGEAQKAYDHAREVYRQRIRESAPD
jgi:hypothetical protein